METLQVFKENAIKAFKSADEKGKKLLSALFGENVLYENIMDRVKEFSDACEVKGISSTVPAFTEIVDPALRRKTQLFYMCSIIEEVLNEGWKPNYKNSNERKWWVWVEWKDTGFGFSAAPYAATYSIVGSRFCFKDEKTAIYFCKQFINLHNEFLTL